MDDETSGYTDQTSLMMQVAAYRMQEILVFPIRKAGMALNAASRHYANLVSDIQDYLISKTVYDLEYQYTKSLKDSIR